MMGLSPDRIGESHLLNSRGARRRRGSGLPHTRDCTRACNTGPCNDGLPSSKITKSVPRGHRCRSPAKAPVEADQDLVEFPPDLSRGATTQVGEEERLVLREDAIPLEPERPIGRDHPFAPEARI